VAEVWTVDDDQHVRLHRDDRRDGFAYTAQDVGEAERNGAKTHDRDVFDREQAV